MAEADLQAQVPTQEEEVHPDQETTVAAQEKEAQTQIQEVQEEDLLQ